MSIIFEMIIRKAHRTTIEEIEGTREMADTFLEAKRLTKQQHKEVMEILNSKPGA